MDKCISQFALLLVVGVKNRETADIHDPKAEDWRRKLVPNQKNKEKKRSTDCSFSFSVINGEILQLVWGCPRGKLETSASLPLAANDVRSRSCPEDFSTVVES